MAFVEDRRRLWVRLSVIQYGITAVFAALALSFWWVQVIEYQRFREMAENNHQRTLPLRAPRGILFDREGRPLVENRDSFRISIVREHSHDLPRTVRLLAGITGLDEESIRREVDRRRKEPVYRPIPIVEDASLAQVAAVMARRFELPDVYVEPVPVRRYPTDALAAHAFGYVGEVSEAQMASEGLPSGAIVGQSGIERAYNQLLMGEDGARRVVVNSVGREIRKIEEAPPTEGRRIQLTIDYELQKADEDGFRELGYNGGAAILDPNTGEVLAMVSLPAYDPNAFAAGIDRDTWASLNSDDLKPLQNRVTQGRYSPGSTFKLAVATAALEEGVATPAFKVHCSGGAVFYGRYFQCHLKGGHGTVDMRHAIEQACNVYFYTLGNLVGVDKMHKWATLLGLGEKTGIDLPNEVEGLVPSTEWKRRTKGEKWYAGETISVSIGQAQVWVTPISMAVYMSTMVNGGRRLGPHFVHAVDGGQGWLFFKLPEESKPPILKPETVQVLRDGLWMVVNGAGTGARGRIPGRDVIGKTGTAQVISLTGKKQAGKTDKDLRDHGWFVFAVPKDNPQIAGVIFAEHAEHGYFAAPIARHVIETFFAKKEGRPLPPFNKAPFLWAATTAAPVGGQ